MRKSYPALAVAAVAAALVVSTGPGQSADSHPRAAAAATPAFDAGNFAHPRPNTWFPLDPGTVTVLRGTDEGKRFRERVRVTDRTRTIEGVAARAVRDILRRADGSLAEATTDWYATDDDGNVWYLGERTATYDRHGHLDSREGSWLAGVKGATPGLIMPAAPQATDAYRQEYWKHHAEDQAWIVGFKGSVRTPMGRFRHVLRTFEWSRLEPRVISSKLYAEGVGVVREHDMVGGSERFEVVAVHRH